MTSMDPVLSEDVAFSCHFMAPLPPNPQPYGSASGIGHASKKLSIMAGNPASSPGYSRYSELR